MLQIGNQNCSSAAFKCGRGREGGSGYSSSVQNLVGSVPPVRMHPNHNLSFSIADLSLLANQLVRSNPGFEFFGGDVFKDTRESIFLRDLRIVILLNYPPLVLGPVIINTLHM